MRPLHFLRLAIVAVILFAAHGAHAQLTSQPYNFRNGSGISPAYRQAILQDKLLGIRPKQMIIDGAGNLAFVQSALGGQAFAFYPQTQFLVGASPGGNLGYASPAPWGTIQGPGYNPLVAGPSGSPINAWIAQLGGVGVSF